MKSPRTPRPHLRLRHAGQDGPLRAPPVEAAAPGEGLLPLPGGLGIGVGQHVEALQRIGVQVRGRRSASGWRRHRRWARRPPGGRQVDGDGGAPRAPGPHDGDGGQGEGPGWFPRASRRTLRRRRPALFLPAGPPGGVRDVQAAPGAARHRSPASLRGRRRGGARRGARGRGPGARPAGAPPGPRPARRRGAPGARGDCLETPAPAPPRPVSGDSGTAGVVAGGVIAVRVGREEDERDTAPAQLEAVARQAVQSKASRAASTSPLRAASNTSSALRQRRATAKVTGSGRWGWVRPGRRILSRSGSPSPAARRTSRGSGSMPLGARRPGGSPEGLGDGSCRERGTRPGGWAGATGRAHGAAPLRGQEHDVQVAVPAGGGQPVHLGPGHRQGDRHRDGGPAPRQIPSPSPPGRHRTGPGGRRRPPRRAAR